MPFLAIRKSMLANFWSIFTRDQRITTTPSCCNNNKTQRQNKFKRQKESNQSMLECHFLPSENPCWLIFGVSSPEISGLRLHHHEAPCNHKPAITTKHNAKPNSKARKKTQIHVAMPCLAIRKSMLAIFWSIFTRDQRITTTPS